MRAFKSVGDLQGFSASKGARVEYAGRAINAGGERVALLPPKRTEPPPPPPPAPAVKPGMSQEDVQALITARDDMWQSRMLAMQQQIDILLRLQLSETRRVPWEMRATYLEDGRIDRLTVTPSEAP